MNGQCDLIFVTFKKMQKIAQKIKLYSVSGGKKNNFISKPLLNNNNKFIYKN